MITPLSLRVRHWGTWDEGAIRLDRPGITFVRGINLDGNTSNYAGKSSIFNSLYASIFGDHQLAAKKRSLKSITVEHTRVRFAMRVDHHAVVGDLRGTAFHVTVDGRALDSRVKNDDRLALLRLMNTTPELWSSTVHVNGIASNPLVRGTSQARCQFLERAFDLDRWADAYQRVGDALSAFKRVQTDLDAARAELRAIPAADAVVDDRLERVRRLAARLRERQTRLGERAAVARSLPQRPPRSVAYYERAVAHMERRLREAESHDRDLRAWREASERHATILEDLRVIPRRDVPPLDAERARARIAALSQRINAAVTIERSAGAVRDWLVLATRIAARHRIAWRTRDDLRALSAGWVSNLRGGDSTCPVCGGSLARPVDRDDVEALAACMRRLPSGELRTRADEDVASLTARLERQRTALADEIHAQVNEAARAELRRALTYVVVPDRPRAPVPCDRITHARLDEHRTLLHDARLWVGRESSEDPDSLRERLRVLRERHDAATRVVGDLERRAADERANARERARLAERIGILEAELSLRPSYKALHAAYSPTGMRLWLLSELLEALVSGLNEVARTRRDRIEFGYRLGRNRDLTITASNVKGTFDVRLLSGAEGNMFCLNLLTVLLPLLPDRRRSNLLVLDELDANCDDRTVDVIAREYLPRLAAVCGTCMVITPNAPRVFTVPGAHELLIEKRNGTSRVRSYR